MYIDKKEILDFKKAFLEEHQDKIRETSIITKFRSVTRDRLLWPLDSLFEEILTLNNLIDKENLEGENKEFVESLIIASLNAINDDELKEDNPLVRKK